MGKVGKSGAKWQKVVKNGWEKWLKVAKSGGKWGKVVRNGEK